MNKALTKEDVVGMLKRGICEVIFTKQNDETRDMIVTLDPARLPEKKEKVKVRSESFSDAIAVYLPGEECWRSFNLARLISIREL
jgi:hypothetical protein